MSSQTKYGHLWIRTPQKEIEQYCRRSCSNSQSSFKNCTPRFNWSHRNFLLI